MKAPDFVRTSSVATLDQRRAMGLSILQRIEQCLAEDETPIGARRAYLEVWLEHRAFLAPL
ncbi:MAG: hypothetical protein JNL81_03760 [Hyphomonadaceae bacterium]|nr:hypothetical protein [Hyphomonadaceae bacterium]